MKIAGIEAIPFRLPLRRDFRWASLQVALGGFVLVRVHTDGPHVGLGEATPLPDWGGDRGRHGGETLGSVVEIVTSVIEPVLLGHDPTAVAAAHVRMDLALRGNTYAKAAVDMALHDLLGKAYGAPIQRLLGGPARPSVVVAHMVGIMSWEDAIAEASEAVADGIKALQIKGGEDAERDVALVTELRQLFGAAVHIRLDANQGYRTAKNTRRALMRLPDRTIDLLEQPVEGLDEMIEVTRSSAIPVIADETCWTPSDALEVVSRRGADALSIYLAKAGGLSAARAVAAIGDAAGMCCDVNGSIESGVGNAANVHFALATPSCTFPAVIPMSAPAGAHPYKVAGHYYEDDIITEPFPVRDGSLLALERPGLGIELDEAKLAKYQLV